VLLISGETKMDYERLVEVYIDEFWRNYRNCFSNLKEKMEHAYKYCTEWARIDWRLRHEEQQQKEMDHERRRKEEQKHKQFLFEEEPDKKQLIEEFIIEYPKKLQ